MVVAPAMTWLLVTTSPLGVMIIPVPWSSWTPPDVPLPKTDWDAGAGDLASIETTAGQHLADHRLDVGGPVEEGRPGRDHLDRGAGVVVAGGRHDASADQGPDQGRGRRHHGPQPARAAMSPADGTVLGGFPFRRGHDGTPHRDTGAGDRARGPFPRPREPVRRGRWSAPATGEGGTGRSERRPLPRWSRSSAEPSDTAPAAAAVAGLSEAVGGDPETSAGPAPSGA